MSYYEEQLKLGEQYQAYVKNWLKPIKKINYYTGMTEQYNIGESVEGIEVKYDKRSEKTENLYIEVAEKSNSTKRNFIPSGVMREDNTKKYLIGNKHKIWVFDKEYLKNICMHRSKIEIDMGTSRGVLLGKYDIEENEHVRIYDLNIDPFWYEREDIFWNY